MSPDGKTTRWTLAAALTALTALAACSRAPPDPLAPLAGLSAPTTLTSAATTTAPLGLWRRCRRSHPSPHPRLHTLEA